MWDTPPSGTQLASEVARQAVDACLGSRVVDTSASAHQRRAGRDVDDRGSAALAKVRNRGTAAVESPGEIHAQRALPHVERHRLDLLHARGPGVVDEYGNTGSLTHLIHAFLHGIGIRDVDN